MRASGELEIKPATLTAHSLIRSSLSTMYIYGYALNFLTL